MSWFHNCLKRFRQSLTRARRPRRHAKVRQPLMLEALEDRTVPSIAFTPQFGAEATQTGNQTYTTPHQVELIFWGSSWSANPALMGQLANAAQVVVNSTYMQGARANYNTAGRDTMDLSHAGGVNPSLQVTGDPAPPPGSTTPAITTGELSAVVSNTENANLLPDPDSVSPTPIYVIVTAPGVTAADAPGASGYHFNANTGGVFDPDPCAMIWTSVQAGGSTSSQVDGFSMTFSHELVETMTDPNAAGGITVTPSASYSNALPKRTGIEIGDNEPANGSSLSSFYGYRLNAQNSSGTVSNALVQAYWAGNRGAYMVEDGNLQTFTLAPNWSGTTFLGTYGLTVKGDQFASNLSDNITIDTSSAGGVVITENGETATFDPGVITSINVQPGGGTNTINIERTPAGVPVTINDAANSTDVISISPTARSLSNIQGSVRIIGSGSDTLTVNDQTDPFGDTYTIDSGKISRTANTGIVYSGVNAVTVNGGSGGTSISPMTYNINSTSATAPVTVNFGNGVNTINVGGTSNILDTIQGTVTVGPSNLFALRGTDTLNINDQGSTAGHTYSLASFNLASGSLTRNGAANLSYALMNQVTVSSGTGADVFTVLGTPQGTGVTINSGGTTNTGGSQDAFQIGTDSSQPGMGNNPLDNIRGPLTINPQSQIPYHPSGLLTFDDLAAPLSGDGHTYSFSTSVGPSGQTSTLTRSNASSITYGVVSSVTLLTSKFNDRIYLGAEPLGTNVTLQAEGGSDTLTSTLASTHTWTINNDGTASLDGLVNAVKMSRLVGGPGVDVFKFASNGNFSGTIDGGGFPLGQGDWLDYSAYSGPVKVDLSTGLATGTVSVSNIQNVLGGNSMNTLRGDARGNILVGGINSTDTITGGSGASLLIAGQGLNKTITGGSTGVGDILIGGYTTYDTDTTNNLTMLMAILAEWQSTDSAPTRFTLINTGLPDGAKLNLGTTVGLNTPFFGHDTLTEAASTTAVDWFFTATPGTWDNHKGIDHINNTM